MTLSRDSRSQTTPILGDNQHGEWRGSKASHRGLNNHGFDRVAVAYARLVRFLVGSTAMLLAMLAIRHDRLQPSTMIGSDLDLDPLAHATMVAWPNLVSRSISS